MSAESEAAFMTALENYRLAIAISTTAPGALADPAPLIAAAQDHVGAVRPHDEVAAEYSAANNSAVDAGRVQELAQELNAVRIAQAIVDGSLPYRPPVVTTGD